MTDISRRQLLINTAAFVGMSMFPLGRWGWAAAGSGKTRKRLVVLFQRGAVDGLSVVVPFTERTYFDRRPTIAIAEPGKDGGAIDLDGRFGLHPALSPLQPLWAADKLAFVHACGIPNGSRSHFEAQESMEGGGPGKRAPDGWMNRLMAVLPNRESPVKAVAVGPKLPAIFQGKMAVATVTLGQRVVGPMALDRPKVYQAFDPLYRGNDPLAKAYHEGLSARRQLLDGLKEENRVADNGAPVPKGFPQTALQVARLMKNDPTVELVFLDLGGWDTHVNQGGADGQLANNLKQVGQGLAVLAEGLGEAFADTLVVVVSEFGRTAAENGNGGTDHGRGNVMWLMGGKVKGGKVYGAWPGLEDNDLDEGRDLAVTTDYRQVLASIMRGHMGLSPAALRSVLPGLTPGKTPPLF